MATSPGDISLEEAPALPGKHLSSRVVTPSPNNYDAPDPNTPPAYKARPPSVHSNQSDSIPGTPSPGYGLVQPYPNVYGSQNGSQHGSRPTTPTSPTVFQANIQPAMQPMPGTRSISYESQTGGPALYGISSKPPASMQVNTVKDRKPKPQGFRLILASSLILSIITIFINPVFGFTAFAFSCVALTARTHFRVLQCGHMAKYTSITGIVLTVILMVVAGVIIGTNNKGY